MAAIILRDGRNPSGITNGQIVAFHAVPVVGIHSHPATMTFPDLNTYQSFSPLFVLYKTVGDTESYPLLPRGVGHREGAHPVRGEREATRRDEDVAVGVHADRHDAGALRRLDVCAPSDLAGHGPELLVELADDALRPRAHGGGHLVEVAPDRHDAAVDASRDAAVARGLVPGYGMP